MTIIEIFLRKVKCQMRDRRYFGGESIAYSPDLRGDPLSSIFSRSLANPLSPPLNNCGWRWFNFVYDPTEGTAWEGRRGRGWCLVMGIRRGIYFSDIRAAHNGHARTRARLSRRGIRVVSRGEFFPCVSPGRNWVPPAIYIPGLGRPIEKGPGIPFPAHSFLAVTLDPRLQSIAMKIDRAVLDATLPETWRNL